VRPVESFEPSPVGTSGAAVAVVCVRVDLEDVDASRFDGEALSELIDVAALALANEVEVVSNDVGGTGNVIVPESVGLAADFSPEQISYRAVVSTLSTVALLHTAFVHE
jgi:hypothetical protein